MKLAYVTCKYHGGRTMLFSYDDKYSTTRVFEWLVGNTDEYDAGGDSEKGQTVTFVYGTPPNIDRVVLMGQIASNELDDIEFDLA
jgi:hypothetical protein